MSENINNIPDEEVNENYITLTDDNGEDVSFEMLGTVEYQDRLFAVLLPFDEDDDGVVILEFTENSDENAFYEDIRKLKAY